MKRFHHKKFLIFLNKRTKRTTIMIFLIMKFFKESQTLMLK